MNSYRTVISAWLVVVACVACPTAFADEAQTVTVAAGTEARLVLVNSMTSQDALTGQKFSLSLDQDIRVAGHVVIPRGTEARGTVVNARKAAANGIAGQLNLRIDYLLLDGRRIPLYAAGVGKSAKSHELASGMLIGFFGPVGMLKKGEKVDFPPGTPVLAYIDANTQITLPSPAAVAAAPVANPNPTSNSTPNSTPSNSQQ